MLNLLAEIKSAFWLLRLIWRISSPKCPPRDQWFVGAADADVQWLADQKACESGSPDANYAVLEARREIARRKGTHE